MKKEKSDKRTNKGVKVESPVFPKIKREYDYYSLTLEEKTYKLLYRIREYTLVSKEKAKNHRKNGIKTKRFGNKMVDGTVETAYYIPYAIKQITLEQKKRVIETLLGKNILEDTMTLREKIEEKWELNTSKTKANPLMDNEAIILDMLANYYLGGVEGEEILTGAMQRTIRREEIVTVSGMYNSDEENNILEFSPSAKNTWVYNKMSKARREHLEKKTPKKWRDSTTSKLNRLFSIVEEEEFEYENWLSGETHICKTDSENVKRLINPKEKYKSCWCPIDTDNIFCYNGSRYQVNKDNEDYKPDINGYYKWDKVLVLEQFNKRYFFDVDVNRLNKVKEI